MRTIWKRLAALFRFRRLEQDLQDEFDHHLALIEAELRATGMDAPSARAEARRQFGSVAQTQEVYRERRGVPWIETSLRDIRYGLRGLGRNRGFTAAAVLSLALGIGANTAVFSLFYALMLRMLPVARPHELVYLFMTGNRSAGYLSSGLYKELAGHKELFAGVVVRNAGGRTSFRTAPEGQPVAARSESVSANYFEVLGVPPAIGRYFTDEETHTIAPQRPVVLGYDLWRNRFGADPKVLGRTLYTESKPLVVIGVAAPRFHGVSVEQAADMWLLARITNDTSTAGFWAIARLRPGVSRRQTQSALDVIMPRFQAALYGSKPDSILKRRQMEQRIDAREAATGLSFLRDEFAAPLRILLLAAELVLLATCANVAHLLLARGAARQREIAVRLSLGASRGRLVRQALTESLLLAALGSALGLFFAWWGTRYLLFFIPAWKLGTLHVAPDRTVLLFAIGISVLAAMAFGLAPALRSTAIDPLASMRPSSGGTGRRMALRRSLVAAQVAFSVVLVAMAGLFGQSLGQLRSVDLGFQDQSVLQFWPNFPSAWKDPQQLAARDRLVTELAATPGIVSVSYNAPDLFHGRSWSSEIRVPGSQPAASVPGRAFLITLGPQYFSTLGAAVTLGREFGRSDSAGSPKVAIVNQAFLRAYLPGERNPLGRVVAMLNEEPGATEPRTIVGTVPDIAHQGVKEKSDPTMYLPASQIETPFGYAAMIVRARIPSAAATAAIRQTAARIAPGLVTETETVREEIDGQIFQDRMLATLSGFFGGLALLLAAVGLYGVVAYTTALRSGEIGIRIALGAPRASVLWLVLRDALLLVTIGLAVGLPFSFAAARAVGSILFGIRPAGPLAFVATSTVLLAIGLAAAFLPARRAAGMNPMQALRSE
jgi:predicted permease